MLVWRIYVAGNNKTLLNTLLCFWLNDFLVNNKTYFGFHVKCPIFWFDMNQILSFSHHIFINVPNIKFKGNPSSGNRAGICRQADMMKLVRTFRGDANAPKQVNKCIWNWKQQWRKRSRHNLKYPGICVQTQNPHRNWSRQCQCWSRIRS